MAIPDVGPGMIPVVVFWTKYTATLNGRVLKLVPCENCSTEYVYVLERDGTGVGTSVYALNDEGARYNAGRFDPNVEDQQARINKGRARAVTRSEFDAGQQRERSAEDGAA